MNRLRSIVAGCLLVLFALPALAQQTGNNAGPGPGYGYPRMHMWGWHGGMIFHPLLGVLILLAIIALIARAGGWRRHGFYRRGGGGGALDIIEERFARGEIDKTEFEEKRKLLNR
jgi:putative membrane protein